MKIIKSIPLIICLAICVFGLNTSVYANQSGEVRVISRTIDRNLERISDVEARRATFKNDFYSKPKKSNRKFSGPIFGDNDCTRRSCGGAMFGPQTCKKIEIPCEDCGEQPKPVRPRPHIKNYVTLEEDIFEAIHHRCSDLAPLQLEWVDFRIKKGRDVGYSKNLGNYRFRIFGCRRDQKHAILNEGRIMQKDMQFIRIFEDKVKDCYNIVKIPNDICLDTVNKPLPEYILTAEITDYFMNLCDEYDWNDAQKENLRTGSAQMTVTWRLMDLSKSNVLWKGTSEGYSDVKEGEYNAEMILIERAFADAVDNLRQLPGFEAQLAVRQNPDDLAEQKQALIAMERLNDPVKCQYQPELQKTQTLCPLTAEGGVSESGGVLADGQVCPADTNPELLAFCPADNPNCNGSLEELTLTQSTTPESQTLIIDKVNATAVDESGNAVDMGGGSVNQASSSQGYIVDENGNIIAINENGGAVDMGGGLTAREAEIAEAAAKAKEKTIQFDTADSSQDFCPLDEDGNPQCEAVDVAEVSVTPPTEFVEGEFNQADMFVDGELADNGVWADVPCTQLSPDDPNYCEPSIFEFLHQKDLTCEPSVFDKMFGTQPSCALNTEQVFELGGFVEENSGITESVVFAENCCGTEECGSCVEENFGLQESGFFIEESCGAESCGISSEVEESSGFVDMSGESTVDGQAWTTLEVAPEETQDMLERNQLCIINRGPYDKLTPENIYKVRASVVGVTNANGLKGAGLLISDQFVLTSADLVVKDNNRYTIKTINGVEMSGRAVRANIKKNTALILLDEKTKFTPLSLNLELPTVGQGGFMALGLFEDEEGGEGYLDNKGKVSGYRYSDEKGTEVIVDTFVQQVTIGSVLIDKNGTIVGLSHIAKKQSDDSDLFLPISTAINSVGLDICGQLAKAPKVPMAVIKPVSTAIDSFTGSKEPKPMDAKGRK